MNLRIVKAALVGTVFAVASFGSVAHAATATGTANAEILADVSVVETTPLDFGTIAVGPTGNTVTADAVANTVTCSGSCTGGALGAFSITGETAMDVDIAVDSTVTLVKLVAGVPVASPTADQQMSASLATDINTLTLDGTDGFKVGGILGVSATQEAGLYEGSYDVTVTYQ